MAKWMQFSKDFDYEYSGRLGEVVAYKKSDQPVYIPVAHADAAVEAGVAEEVDAPAEDAAAASESSPRRGRPRKGE
jgi:hypothetical protein